MQLLKICASTLFILISFATWAQDSQYTSSTDSDPAAKALVEKIRKKYDDYSAMTADFSLDISLPGQPVETQAGTLSRRGDLVRFKLGQQEGIVNGEAVYVILHGNKEVQINNLPEPGELTGVLTPQTLFSFYEGDQYILALQGRETFRGKQLQSIELKPVDRYNSDFTKLRLLVDDRALEIASVKAMAADGSSYTFILDKTVANPKLPATTFAFSKADFPGYHVEDLRY